MKVLKINTMDSFIFPKGPYQWPTETCNCCRRTIPEMCVYCPYCGILHNIMNRRFVLRLRRSTRLWCKHCFHTSECYSHDFCSNCGYNYKFQESKL